MQNKLNYLRALINKRLHNMEERGASAVEYGLLVAGIAMIIIVAVFFLGKKISDLFTSSGNGVGSDPGGTPTTNFPSPE